MGKLTITNKYGNEQIEAYIGSTELTVGSSAITMDEPVIKSKKLRKYFRRNNLCTGF